ncbi:Sirohydrochlorin cobaltochelatase [bacterium HR36]|uniref:Cobalamin (Vitamin B12) biosynthesis CbiX protein n=1 Tax=uncultured Planctomycetota bacterium TaxID=120965 RepID=H5S886_9BACT|nr:cobalamin (vitamin B12) biosynthesis CbiX protein [uncultured Planctomycetota bacterium]GBD36238.1 Sirohydrochlorin cobaltochelatase [bacterium HR36]
MSNLAGSQMATAILLIAHGSRRAEANAELEWVAARLQERLPGFFVEHAYLEIAEPTIAQGIARCLEHGVSSVILVPYFLSAGRHVREDLESARAQAAHQYPQAKFFLAEALGPHDLLVELMVLRIQEVLKNSPAAIPPVPPETSHAG